MILRHLFLAALCALSTLSGQAGAQQTPGELLEEIRRARDGVDPQVFERLGRLGTAEALTALEQAVGLVRQTPPLESGFGAFRHFRGKEGLERRAITFVATSAEGSFEPSRRAAARGLSFFGEAAAPELRRLVERSRDAECRAWAIGPLIPGLVSAGGATNLALALDNLQVGPSGTREALLGHLRIVTTPELLPVLAARVADRKVEPRLKALIVEALAAVESAAVVPTLRAALRDASEVVQYAALLALTERRESAHEGDLRRLLRAEDAALRRLVIVSLGKIRGEAEGWPRELLGYSQDRIPAIRMGAAVALAELRTPEALERLHAMLADPDRAVRAEALQQVGNLRRKDSIPILIQRVNGESGQLRSDVLTVLRLVTGQDQGTTYERWKRWWDGEGEAFAVPPHDEALAAERRRNSQRRDGRTASSFYGLEVVSDRVCFVLDTSGSMRGAVSGGRTRMDVAREELARVLEGYPDGDLFNVIFFSTDVMAWQDRLVAMDSKTRPAALGYVRRQNAEGYTAVYDALARAFEDERIDTIYLLTDGAPYRGSIDDPGEIRAAVRRWNSARHVRVHTVSIGTESGLLRDLARDTGGEYRSVRD